ncbi:hypothetical protein N0V90_001101 [Kalmusia sp. IMI 367209]|nr:hypothetical protein N0V90_001101 [Kalmusia sp. IMI 367209]
MTSLHTLAIPPLIRGMLNLTAILKRAETSGISPASIFASRIHPTMFPFPSQIFFLTRMAANIPTDINPSLPMFTVPPFEDSPSFDSLIARIAKTVAYLEGIKPEDLNGREGEKVNLRIERKFSGNVAYIEYGAAEYVGMHAHPYFWFHVVTAYDLLRKEGVELGKIDFLNAAGLHEWVLKVE